MNKIFTFRRCASAMSLLAFTALGSNVFASGYGVRELSVYAQGSSYAGASSSTDSITYMYFNPAMLVHQTGHQFQGGAFTLFPHSTASDVTAAVPTTAGTIPLTQANEVGNFGKYALTGNAYLMGDWCNDLKFGLAITAPWGLENDYGPNKNWNGRFHALHSQLITVNINPMIAYRVSEKWSVGAGFQAQYMDADLTNKFGYPGTLLALTGIPSLVPLAQPAFEPFARIQGNGWGYGFNAGIMYQPWESTTFGIGYRSQVAHELGNEDSEFLQPLLNYLSLTPQGQAAIPTLRAAGIILNIPYKVAATAKVRTPDQLNFGVTHEFNEQWAVMADAQWTHWSKLNELRIQFEEGIPLLASDSVVLTEWGNAWWGSLGASFKPDCHWVLRTGFAYDQSPSRNDALRTPRIPDSDRYWASVGATYHINYHFSIDAAYTHVFVKDTEIRITSSSPQGAASGPLSANYSDGRVDILGLGGTFRF